MARWPGPVHLRVARLSTSMINDHRDSPGQSVEPGAIDTSPPSPQHPPASRRRQRQSARDRSPRTTISHVFITEPRFLKTVQLCVMVIFDIRRRHFRLSHNLLTTHTYYFFNFSQLCAEIRITLKFRSWILPTSDGNNLHLVQIFHEFHNQSASLAWRD